MGENNSGLSVADALALRNGGNGNNNGWGDGSAWWIIILVLLFGYGGNWGGRGFNNGSNGTGDGTVNNFGVSPFGLNACCTPATQQAMTDAFNFNSLASGQTSIESDLSTGFNAVNLGLANLGSQLQQTMSASDIAALQNTNAIQTSIMQGNNATQLGMVQGNNATQMSIMQGNNTLQSALCNGFNGVSNAFAQQAYNMQDCCCRTREAITQNGFDNLTGMNALQAQAATNANALQNQIATNACDIERGQKDITYAMNQMANNILQASERNADRIINHMVDNELETLRNRLSTAEFQLSQAAQTNALINQLQPVAKPAYITASPYASQNPYGCGNGTCCGV